MTAQADPVAVLLVPTAVGSVVLPSAVVCEIAVNSRILPVPGAEPWLLGFCIWRNLPVSIISFERLLGAEMLKRASNKIVVLYPLPGRQRHEYFAIAAADQPRSAQIDADARPAHGLHVPEPFVAGTLEMPEGAGLIPDFDALRKIFYAG